MIKYKTIILTYKQVFLHFLSSSSFFLIYLINLRKITEDEIDEIWLAYLTELNKKMSYTKQKQGKNIKALKDVGPELEKLRLKVNLFCLFIYYVLIYI